MILDMNGLSAMADGDPMLASIRGELKRGGRPIPGNDVWIAALARQHSMPVLSREEHFDYVPHVKRIDW